CDDGALNGTYGHCAGSDSYSLQDIENFLNEAGSQSGESCTANYQCNDGNPCNLDRCFKGFCKFSPGLEVLCDSGESASCNLQHPEYCGDGVLQSNEFCDIGQLHYTSGYCSNDPSKLCVFDLDCIEVDGSNPGHCVGGGIPNYSLLQGNSCALDCQKPGAYCGDGIIQFEHEDCDDGNDVNDDGCNNFCEKDPAIKCKEANIQHFYGQTPFAIGGDVHHYFLTRLSENMFNNFQSHYTSNPAQLGPFYPGEEQVMDCLENLTCNDICSSMGEDFTCPFAFRTSYLSDTQAKWDYIANTANLSNYLDESPEDNVYIAMCQGPQTQTSSQVEPGECGDAIIDEGETCDLGSQNGIACTPIYGESCSYCSVNCQNVIKVDPIAYCGNGQIDVIPSGDGSPGEDEDCDFDLAGNVYGDLGLRECPDRGEYQCLNQCTLLDASGCVVCRIYQDGSKATPKISLLNPMIKNETLSSNWPIEFVGILFRNEFEDDGTKKVGEPLAFYDHRQGSGGWASVPEQENDFLRMDEEYVADLGLESDELCQGEYGLAFLPSFESFLGTLINPDPGWLLPYAVDGETDKVRNEYIYSPPVPEQTFRVVVRWGSGAGGQLDFAGGVYTEEDPGDPEIHYLESIDGLCTKIEKVDGSDFWTPANCNSYPENHVYVHAQNGLNDTFIQSFTIDTNGAAEDIGFFVQSLTVDRIAKSKFKEIFVDVYEYEGGSTAGFVYSPAYTFKIQDAAGTSSNPSAKYWQPFNLERQSNGTYEVVPINSIETDMCQVKLNILPASECQNL
ncbi:MAG: hypothetical protein ABII02_04295, partial [Candidatus Magasanikbacteria bacterium]